MSSSATRDSPGSPLGHRIAVREDARDFTLWMQLADKPVRVHWRNRGKALSGYPGASHRLSPRVRRTP
ncbi:hypothetical protein ACFZA1_30535 [Streptomyces filipinensis]|uniref:hypothetical protein n=1 Tax=Streptomyces filipinensis TaxID=66887 RepID=UPI0036E436A2